MNSEKDPLTGISPVSLLFERSLRFTQKINVTFQQTIMLDDNDTKGKLFNVAQNYDNSITLTGLAVT